MRKTMLLLTMLFTLSAAAAEPAGEEPPAPRESEGSDTSSEPNAAAVPNERDEAQPESSPYVFTPSEEISEDLAVAFPVDI